jgi:hypothetical protein
MESGIEKKREGKVIKGGKENRNEYGNNAIQFKAV